jgi:GTP-binding protein
VTIDGKEFVLADIPGLIEGAHEGVGLGTRFLGHVERAGILLHLVDGTQEDVVSAYETIRGELEAYDPVLAEKAEILALNKCDALDDEEFAEKKAALEEASGKQVFRLSGATGEGVPDVLRAMMVFIEAARAINQPPAQPDMYRANEEPPAEESDAE